MLIKAGCHGHIDMLTSNVGLHGHVVNPCMRMVT